MTVPATIEDKIKLRTAQDICSNVANRIQERMLQMQAFHGVTIGTVHELKGDIRNIVFNEIETHTNVYIERCPETLD